MYVYIHISVHIYIYTYISTYMCMYMYLRQAKKLLLSRSALKVLGIGPVSAWE